ncbi:hypothetical protein GCM10027299_47770 [Larkinella ripae]
MTHFLGGYFLLRLKPFAWSPTGQAVYTASTCLNDSLLNTWSYSWTNKASEKDEAVKENFDLDDGRLALLRAWVDEKHTTGVVGWMSVFGDRASALDYKRRFFAHLNGVETLAVYFNEQQTADLLREFAPESERIGAIGLYQTLLKKERETENSAEILIGFDLIGLESSGNFHSFHCHGIGGELADRFGLTLNHYGLFDDCADWKPVLHALNTGEIGAEPVPWYVAKVKLLSSI